MRCRLPVLAGVIVFVIGCSNEPYQVGQVSGRITVDGKPVEKAAIMQARCQVTRPVRMQA